MRWFARLPIGFRLLFLVVLFVAALAGLTLHGLVTARDQHLAERQLKTKHLAQTALSLVAKYQADEKSGALSQADAQAAAKEALRAMRYDGKEYFWINDMVPRVLMHPYLPELQGVDLGQQANKSLLPLFQAFVDVVRRQGEGFHAYDWPKAGADKNRLYPKTSYVVGFAPWGWVIGTGIYIDDVEEAFRKDAIRVGGIAAIVILALLAIAWAISRSIVRPVAATTTVLEALAQGDSSIAVEAEPGRRDEIGRMALSVAALRDTVAAAFTQARVIDELPIAVMTADAASGLKINYANKAAVELIDALKSHLSFAPEQLLGRSADLLFPDPPLARRTLLAPELLPWSARMQIGDETLLVKASAVLDRAGRYAGPMLAWHTTTRQEQLVRRFEATVSQSVQSMEQALGQIAGRAQAMRSSSDAALSRSGSVAAAAEQTSANVQTVSAATEELAASIQEITQQIERSTSMANAATGTAESTTVQAAALGEAVQKIGIVTELINGIASQTNLLALNATIEAARAGDAGKGFAVVASEVKGLAAQTAKATEEIAQQIAEVQRSAGATTASVQNVAEAIREITSIFSSVAAAVEEQQAATREIARNVAEAARGTQDVSQMIGEVRDATQAVDSEAGTVDRVASESAATAAKMGRSVEEFLGVLRADA